MLAVAALALPLGALGCSLGNSWLSASRAVRPGADLIGNRINVTVRLDNPTCLETACSCSDVTPPYQLGPGARFVVPGVPGGDRELLHYEARRRPGAATRSARWPSAWPTRSGSPRSPRSWPLPRRDRPPPGGAADRPRPGRRAGLLGRDQGPLPVLPGRRVLHHSVYRDGDETCARSTGAPRPSGPADDPPGGAPRRPGR